MLHPIVPKMTEEIWEIIGKKRYLSLTTWPSYEKSLLTKESDYKWNLMKIILNNIKNIMLVMKREVADYWKVHFYKKLMSLLEETNDPGEIMRDFLQDKALEEHRKFIGQTIRTILKNTGKYLKFTLSSEDEYLFFSEIRLVIEKKFNCKVEIVIEKKSTEQKVV